MLRTTMHKINLTCRILFLVSSASVLFLVSWTPATQAAPQTYFYGTANINAPFAIHNFAMDNRSVNDALPMFLNRGKAAAAATASAQAKPALPGTKDAHGKDKPDAEKGAEKDYEDYSDK